MGDGEDAVNPYAVRSLERGLRILSCFDIDHSSLTLGELCHGTGLHKATCFRLVKTLEAEGYLAAADSSGEYRLGAALLRTALLARSDDALARLAHPHLVALTEATGETADLTTWSHEGPLLVDRSLTSRAFQPRNTVGQVLLDPWSTHGMIWLAFGTAAQRRRALALYARQDAAGAGQIDELERDLDAVRRDGYAVDIGEERGVCALGAPVWGASDEMLACLSVVAPFRQAPTETLENRRIVLMRTAAALSEALGHRI